MGYTSYDKVVAENGFYTKSVGNEALAIDADGKGTGQNFTVLYQDINFEALSLGTGASAPDLINVFGTGGIKGLGFDGNVTLEQVYGGGEMLHDYKEGTDISFHVHWMPTTNTAGDVKWNLEYSWYNAETDAEIPAPQTISVVQSSGGDDWKAHVIEFPTISGIGKKIGSHLKFRFYRNPSDGADTYPDDAVLDSIGVHYQVDSDGSRQLYIK